MSSNEQRWLDALAFDREHEEHGPVVLAARIAEMQASGDLDGELYWRDVNRKLMLLHQSGAGLWH